MHFSQIIRALAASFVLAAVGFMPSASALQQAGAIAIENPWIAATNPGATVAAGYVTLRNTGGESDRLVSARSTSAARVELHQMSMSNGIMRMQPVEAIVIPAAGAATLEPGGLHIMFLDIHAQYQAGARVPVTLYFERAGDVEVQFDVRPRGSSGHEH